MDKRIYDTNNTFFHFNLHFLYIDDTKQIIFEKIEVYFSIQINIFISKLNNCYISNSSKMSFPFFLHLF